MKKNTFTEMLYKNAGYLAVLLISIAYIVSSLVTISKTGKSILEIIGAGVLSLIVGVLITSAFRSTGVRKGDESDIMLSTNELHGKTVDEITPYIDKLDSYCENENKEALRRIRTKILAKAGLKYESCFDENGIALEITIDYKSCQPSAVSSQREVKKKIKQKKRAYNRAVHLKFKPLLASNLTSNGVSADNPFDFGTSKKEYASQKNMTDLFSRVLMAIIFGYFSVSLATSIDYATLIWNALQIVMYIVGGVIQMYASYNWIVDDYRQSIIKKIDYLQKFKIFAEKENGGGAVENGKLPAVSHMPTEN